MTQGANVGPRCVVIVGPYLSGKTNLFEALLKAIGGCAQKGNAADRTLVGDHSSEASKRQSSTQLSVAGGTFLDQPWVFIDTPGASEFAQDARDACMIADIVIVVVEPETEKMVAVTPFLYFLDRHKIPHLILINKMDQNTTPVRDLMAALQTISSRPLVLRQVPLRDGEAITGYIDLVSERAYRYQPGAASALIEIPASAATRGADARNTLLETIADFDDVILEQLLDDQRPDNSAVYENFTATLTADALVPVLLGAGLLDHGVQRLLKMLRHDTPAADAAAQRRGIDMVDEAVVEVFKTLHVAHTGKLSLVRVWRGELRDGMQLNNQRLSGIHSMFGAKLSCCERAVAGQVVALGRLEETATGTAATASGQVLNQRLPWPATLPSMYALAIHASNRNDEVKLSGALQKLADEDRALRVEHNSELAELILHGLGDIHLAVVLERLQDRFNLAVDTGVPQVAYRETISRSASQHARHKKQSGGHGQFGDVVVTIDPQPRGAGFQFVSAITGGAVPRNYIPAVEEGVKDFLRQGPLGFPVVDLAVTLTDGSHHSVDSSEMAFRTAGRLAMSEGIAKCGAVLLEPIERVEISTPNSATARMQRVIAGHRGQVLGYEMKPGWHGWDVFTAFMPAAELQQLIIEIRALSQGVGFFRAEFDHMAELQGRDRTEVVDARKAVLGL